MTRVIEAVTQTICNKVWRIESMNKLLGLFLLVLLLISLNGCNGNNKASTMADSFASEKDIKIAGEQCSSAMPNSDGQCVDDTFYTKTDKYCSANKLNKEECDQLHTEVNLRVTKYIKEETEKLRQFTDSIKRQNTEDTKKTEDLKRLANAPIQSNKH